MITTGSGRVLLLALCALLVGCAALRRPRREEPKPIKRTSLSGPFEPHDLLASAPFDRDDEVERAVVADALATWVDRLISLELGATGALLDPLVELRRRLVEQNVEPALETAVWHRVAGGWTCQGPSAHVHLQVNAAPARAELARVAAERAPTPITVRVRCRPDGGDEELRREVERALRAHLSAHEYTLTSAPPLASDRRRTLAELARSHADNALGVGVDLSVTLREQTLEADAAVEFSSPSAGLDPEKLHVGSSWTREAPRPADGPLVGVHAADIGRWLGDRIVSRLRSEWPAADGSPARMTELLVLRLVAALPRWEDPDQRVCVLMAIAQLGAGAAAAAPAVTRALTDDPETMVRVAAARTLGELGPDAREATSALTRSLRSEDGGLRLAAATALGRIRPDSPATVAALIASLSDHEHSVRRAAVHALGEIGPPAAQAVPFLVDLLRPPGDSMVRDAAEALGKLGDGFAVPALIEVVTRHEEQGHRIKAAEALGRLGPLAAAAAPALLERLRAEQTHDYEQRAAARALGTIGAPELAAPALIPLMNPATDLGRDAIEALGALGPAAGDAAARALLRCFLETQRWCTHDALVKLGELSVALLIPELAGLSTDDVSINFRDDPRFRLLVSLGADAVPALLAEARAGRLLGVGDSALTRMGATAVPPLVEATRSDDPGLRLAALRGLVSADLFAKERVAAIDVAVEALEGDPDPEVRAAATTTRDALKAQRARIWPNGRPTR